jgi:hypothetical protein
MGPEDKVYIPGWIQFQAGLQRRCPSGNLIPALMKLHSEEVEYTFDPTMNVESIKDAIVVAAQRETKDCFPRRWNGNSLKIDVFTPGAKWLDVITITLYVSSSTSASARNPQDSDKGYSAKVVCTSTGVLPMSIPLAPLLNLSLFWIPFGDNGESARQHSELANAINAVKGAGTVTSRTIRTSWDGDQRRKALAVASNGN